MSLVRSGCTQRFRDSDNDMLQEWASIPAVPTDVLPTCNLLANVPRMHGLKSRQKERRPSHQTKLEKEQRLHSSVRHEFCNAEQPDQESRDFHACIVTPTYCERSQSP